MKLDQTTMLIIGNKPLIGTMLCDALFLSYVSTQSTPPTSKVKVIGHWNNEMWYEFDENVDLFDHKSFNHNGVVFFSTTCQWSMCHAKEP